MDKIVIAGLRELGVHGVLPEEQGRPQPFEVDVELDVDTTAAGESDHLDDTVDYSAVSEAVSRLSPEHRAVLLECYYRGRSVAEAAERLGVPEGTVKSRTHYALRALRLALEEMGVGA